MRKLLSFIRPHLAECAFLIGCLLLLFSLGILALHADGFEQTQQQILRVSSRLPPLLSRVATLESDRRASEYFFEHSLNAKEELTRAYVLPDTFSLPLFERRFRQIASLFPSISPQSFTLVSSTPREGSVVHSVNITLRSPLSSFSSLLQFLELSGKFFIADALPATTQSALLDRLSREEPQALLSFRQFLFTDLLAYSMNPTAFHEQFFSSLPLSLRDEIVAKSSADGLSRVRTVLLPLSSRLQSERLFPFSLLTIRSFDARNDSITLLVDVYSRE